MPVQRKVFSIEQYAPRCERLGQVEGKTADPASAQRAEMPAHENEFRLIQAAVDRIKNEMARLGRNATTGGRIARANRELKAITAGTEGAAHTILQAAEDIDEAANTLSAALKSGHEQELAQDIRDSVTQIFEACNFQDVTGQRIAHVTATLTFVEEQIARMLQVCDGAPAPLETTDASRESGRKLLNGPRLADDCGHSPQTEIDLMFRCA